MKNGIFYIGLIFLFSVLQTVVVPETITIFNSFFSTNVFSHFYIDFFLLLVIYFSFNRDFFHGLLWVLILYFVESSMGHFWNGARVPSMAAIFLIIQVLKIQFVFINFYSIRVAVSALIFVKFSLHLYFGMDSITLWMVIKGYFFTILFSSLYHAWMAPFLFYWFNQTDVRTLYQFEKQRTLFSTSMRML